MTVSHPSRKVPLAQVEAVRAHHQAGEQGPQRVDVEAREARHAGEELLSGGSPRIRWKYSAVPRR